MQVVANLAHPWRIMIFSKNRFPLFGIMLQPPDAIPVSRVARSVFSSPLRSERR
jgi:hypothetical protein